jgi:DNA-directed RNA polymerase specialized sigma24 family protein
VTASELANVYEPDEDLKLEDIIPDLEAPNPEEEAERLELQRCARAALAEMPREQRRARLLRYDDELPMPQLARALHKPEPEARRILEEASHELRRRLREAGCRFKVSDV